MRRNCLILTIFVTGCVLLFQIGCQQETAVTEGPVTTLTKPETPTVPAEAQITKPKPKKGGPRITFEKESLFLGEVGPGTRNVCEFKFKNTGDAMLKIEKVSKTCSCTPFSLKKRQYAPGESGVVKITYHASSSPGTVTRRLYVNSNDETRPKVAVSIKARIALKVTHRPKELKLLLKQENAKCPKITLTSVDGQPFAVKSFRAPGNCITASYDSSVKAKKLVLEPKVDLEKLEKNLKGSIRITLTHPKCRMITVPFNVLPRFKINPSPTIFARNAEPQKPIKREIWILNNYGEDFEVESTSSKNDIIKVLNREKVGNRYKFELEVVPPAAEGNRRTFTDVLYVNIKGDEKLKISCSGFYPSEKKK